MHNYDYTRTQESEGNDLKYFSKTNICFEGNEQNDKLIYVMLPEPKKENEVPMLTKDILFDNQEFRGAIGNTKKRITIIFTVYKTDKNVNASWKTEEFDALIQDRGAENCSSTSDFFIEGFKDNKAKKPKKAKISKWMIAGIAALSLAVGFVGALGLAKKLLPNNSSVSNQGQKDENADGLIIPKQEAISADTEQITVSIDRSYAAVPTEDLQLKGAIANGEAQIQLPSFDKEDFFTHVSGYTWGFSTNPKAEKAQYYGGQTYTFKEDTKLYRVLIKYGGGSGTKEDPYLIDYYDQLELISTEKARGYFKQTADISFPEWASHKPIDTVNELKDTPKDERFEYDGGGYLIEGLTSPLFGKVSGAVIKNVNVRNSKIASNEYKDFGCIVCDALNYRYKSDDKTYETGETLIQNCTVSHTSITLSLPESEVIETEPPTVTTMEVVPPDLIEYDENGNVIEPDTTTVPEPTKIAEYCIGAISGLGGQIENCYVQDFGIYNNLPDYFLYAGGISGKPANVINSSVYFVSTDGNIFNAGGIVGCASGARLYDANGRELPEYYGGNILGCSAGLALLSAEVATGGIAGEGGTNAQNAVISNCYANKLQCTCGEFNAENVLIKAGAIGGIIGSDNSSSHGHLITNTVSMTEHPILGKKIKSSYDDTVRQAPDYAFYQENILTVLNKNTVHPSNPKEIFTGSFTFAHDGSFGDENGALAFPSGLKDLLPKTINEEVQ